MTRIAAFDSLRGALLLVMALNHVPSDLRVLTDQPLGFFSAAEGFVFVSGLLAGNRALGNAILIGAMFATARYSVTTTEVTSPISTES